MPISGRKILSQKPFSILTRTVHIANTPLSVIEPGMWIVVDEFTVLPKSN